jgi:hypothetical protein
MSDHTPPPPPKQGLSGGAIAGIGCGALFLLMCIGGGVLVMKGCSKVKEMAGDFKKNPAKAGATLAVKANPQLEFISTDDSKGTITFKDKSSGEVMTMSYNDMAQGKVTITDAEGKQTTIDASDGAQGRVVMKGPDGETVIGGSGTETAPPAWVPTYPGAAAQQGGMKSEANGVVSGMSMLQSQDPVAKVKDYYEAQLKAAGFEVETNTFNLNGAESATLTATKNDGNTTANVMINHEGGATNIVVTYEAPK